MPKPIIKDHGQLLAVNCPECNKQSGYKLMQKTFAAPFIFKLLLAKDTHLWNIECMNCSHSVKVPKEEAANIPEVQKMSDKMVAGEITPEEFHQVFSQFSFIIELLNQAHSWNCPTCAERVDWKLQVCWNCSTPNPEINAAAKQVEMPKFVAPA